MWKLFVGVFHRWFSFSLMLSPRAAVSSGAVTALCRTQSLPRCDSILHLLVFLGSFEIVRSLPAGFCFSFVCLLPCEWLSSCAGAVLISLTLKFTLHIFSHFLPHGLISIREPSVCSCATLWVVWTGMLPLSQWHCCRLHVGSGFKAKITLEQIMSRSSRAAFAPQLLIAL